MILTPPLLALPFPQIIDVANQHQRIIDDNTGETYNTHDCHKAHRFIMQAKGDNDPRNTERNGQHDNKRLRE